MRALADPTRLRVMRLLSAMELAVGELAHVLGQSQPRVSRHVAILCDAGLAERHKEGSWVFLRSALAAPDDGKLARAVSSLLAAAEAEDSEFADQCAADRRLLAQIRDTRERHAADYFARHAAEWDKLRDLLTPADQVEDALVEVLSSEPLGQVLDIGTGTGRIAELLADNKGLGADHIVALDKSPEMLRLARAKLQSLPTGEVELVQGDFGALPFADAVFDTVVFHQVLHYASEPAYALAEASRVTRPGGRIAIVDLAAHTQEDLRRTHAHARLGFEDAQMVRMLESHGFDPAPVQRLDGGELAVSIWTGRRMGSSVTRIDSGVASAVPSISRQNTRKTQRR
ncbi:Demethylmenaquinone methyltransferase [Alteripontixanthobacter maritimus]|uniref:Demethylmenaquinone methyltransferase n=2 Tax=Alteripontixanthobacter maritimus TaxID=2161824 RepID=A0A369QEM0_9SPHN|nr:Demethylmenaquinone methyltransferase [Alteripontixanthobacter maritimus]